MTAVYLLLLAAAAMIWFLPSLRLPSLPSLPASGAPAKRPGITYAAAIDDLANVRRRLIETDLLADAQRQAIDALTLALVAGSDK